MTEDITKKLKQLNKKFPEEDLEWRVQRCGVTSNNNANNKPWAMVIPYVTNRAIIKRLNEVVGAGAWQNEYKLSPCGKGYLCGISIKVGDEWVTKWDGAELTGGDYIDNVKTTASTSMKRAGVQWGIGAYLYDFSENFADCKLCDSRFNVLDGYEYAKAKIKGTKTEVGIQWKPQPIEAWALPVTKGQVNAIIEAMRCVKTLTELQTVWKHAYKLATSEDDEEMMKTFLDDKEAKKEWFSKAKVHQAEELNQKQEKLLNECINLVSGAINESTAKGIAETQIQKIGEKYRGEFYTKAVKEIKKAASDRITQLKNR